MNKTIFELITNLPEPYTDINFQTRPPFWVMAPHLHNFYQVVLITSGVLYVGLEQKEKKLSKGFICIIPPGWTHSFKTNEGFSQLGINLTPSVDTRGIIHVLESFVEKPLVLDRSDVLNSIIILKNESQKHSPLSKLRISNILDDILISTVESLAPEGITCFRSKLLSMLNRQFSSPVTLKQLSMSLTISQTQLERLCRKEFGCSVIELFNRLKINKACILLNNTENSIGEIAAILGFCDQAYFCRLFKKKMSVTPGEYRKRVEYGI